MQPTRRPLIDGLAKSLPDVDPIKAAAFITGEAAAPAARPHLDRSLRSPLTSRLRGDIGEALKRASLERQLTGETPWAVQDILDEALQPWLESRGYLK